MNNIILIGMPGAGKSTVGVLLAKALCYDFIDTDLLIQNKHGSTLQTLIDQNGADAFLRMEEETLCSLHCKNSVVATGGSAVYSILGMDYLRSIGCIVYLHADYETLARRVNNMTSRGIVLDSGMSLKSLYDHRRPLYEKYADITITSTGASPEQVIDAIIKSL